MLSVLCWLSGYAQLKVVEKPYFLEVVPFGHFVGRRQAICLEEG